MKMLRLTVICITLLYLCGCASTMQVHPPPKDLTTIADGQARIRVHRPQVFGSALAIEVKDNGDTVGKVGPLGTITWDRPAGVASLSGYEPFNGKSYGPLKLTTEPGKQYNVNVSVSLSSGLFTLQSVSALYVPNRTPVQHARMDTPQQAKPQSLVPAITPRTQPIQASLVIVHDPSCTTVASNWVDRVSKTLKHRNLFTSIEVFFDKPNRQLPGFGTNDAENAFTLLLYYDERNAADGTLVVKGSWVKDAGGIDKYPNLMLWHPNETLPCSSAQDVAAWVERIELIATQDSIQDAISLVACLQKPNIEKKRHYVNQSFSGWSLCKADGSSWNSDVYMVVGIGQPFYADGQWFEKPLYWCGTFQYENKAGDTRTVPRYATSLDLAIQQMRSQIYPPEPEPQKQATSATEPDDTEDLRHRFQTGFCISSNGHVVTCAHGLENAAKVSVYLNNWVEAKVLAMDKHNDIAILKIDAQTTPIPIQGEIPHQGDDITVWGFPNPELQGENLKATKGSINSLSGIQDDIRLLQLDAAVQPGNSGSPVVSVDGKAVGMVISRLDDFATLALTATLPQNVNYAIKSAYLIPVIQSAGVSLPGSDQPLASNVASRSVVLIKILSQTKGKVSQ